ncbi:hypothetical protein K8R04_00240 [Candidatus Uhrbacteria bacterium]|nr:hypothetical protein [Candidatus Uhrbacteria bacterium]
MTTQAKKKATKPAPAVRTGSLAVTVHDEDGHPRLKMRVQISSKSKVLGEFLTDADGDVVFPGLIIGQTYFVRVNGDEAFEEIEIDRVRDTLEIEYDGELASVPKDDEDADSEGDSEEEDEEDLDTPRDELDELD